MAVDRESLPRRGIYYIGIDIYIGSTTKVKSVLRQAHMHVGQTHRAAIKGWKAGPTSIQYKRARFDVSYSSQSVHTSRDLSNCITLAESLLRAPVLQMESYSYL